MGWRASIVRGQTNAGHISGDQWHLLIDKCAIIFYHVSRYPIHRTIMNWHCSGIQIAIAVAVYTILYLNAGKHAQELRDVSAELARVIIRKGSHSSI